MLRVGFLVVLLGALLAACVGDSSSNGDAGGSDAGYDVVLPDGAQPGTCVFGGSQFGDGCKFGP